MKSLRYLWTSALILGVLAIPGVAIAEDGPSWSFVEAGFNSVNLDELDDNGDGYFVGVTFGGEHWHVFGRFIDNTTDESDLDITRWYAGGGWHGLLGEKADLLAEAAYLKADYDIVDDSGYFVRGGVRWRPFELFEVGGFARWEDTGDLDDVPEFENDVIWEANAMVYLWRFSIGVGYELESNVDTFNAFARFNF